MENCLEILEASLKRVMSHPARPVVSNPAIAARITAVVDCPSNRAGVRLLMACMLAKVHRPEVDPRKPYTEIGGAASFSGRTYDEQVLGQFITRHNLPCNPTTAFLTPALRNMDQALTTKVVIVGRPAAMYQNALLLLDDVYSKRISANEVLDESIRLLILERDARAERLKTLLSGLARVADALPLSSEDTVNLMQQHLRCKGSSRLPVLVIAAAYDAAMHNLGERVVGLNLEAVAAQSPRLARSWLGGPTLGSTPVPISTSKRLWP